MNAPITANSLSDMDRLARAAADLGFEVVDIASFLDLLENQSKMQRSALSALTSCASELTSTNEAASGILKALTEHSEKTREDVNASVALVRKMGDKTRSVAVWVRAVRDRTETVSETLKAVKDNNSEIAAIATQVNTLAINAKIEAARAGDAGRGFAVVADAINDLSKKTGTAARQITDNIDTLTNWIKDIGQQSEGVAEDASAVLAQSEKTDEALSRMESSITREHEESLALQKQTDEVRRAVSELRPAVRAIDTSIQETSGGIESAHKRVDNLVESSEQIVQLTAGLGGTTPDAPFIALVQKTAGMIGKSMEDAIASGRITRDALFDKAYVPVPGSNPQQVTNRAVSFLDQLLPSFQEPILEVDPKIVFCAAVDTNGYLPTHNLKFSKPQTDDPVWNTANSRNRRIFDDRVGLKAGKNRSHFLLQVYRRDMGGGEFRVMKDLSAPIMVNGQHWGGLRLAYS